MGKEQLVLFNSNGTYSKEVDLSKIWGLDHTGRIIHFSGTTDLGYRGEQALAIIENEMKGKKTFASASATALFLQVCWSVMECGKDSRGRYVSFFGRKLYDTFDVYKPDGELLSRNGGGYLNYRLNIRINKLVFHMDTFLLSYLLFYNKENVNPLMNLISVAPKTGKFESNDIADFVVDVKKNNRKDALALISLLREENLILQGLLNYDTLANTSTLPSVLLDKKNPLSFSKLFGGQAKSKAVVTPVQEEEQTERPLVVQSDIVHTPKSEQGVTDVTESSEQPTKLETRIEFRHHAKKRVTLGTDWKDEEPKPIHVLPDTLVLMGGSPTTEKEETKNKECVVYA